MKEAIDLVLKYSPLPATVCGQICPNLCMQSCSRGRVDRPLNIKEMGSLALKQPAPKPAKKTGHKIAVIGGGPAGLSAAWQLGLKGHSIDLYESADKLGGKIELCIPRERLPQKILLKELSRFGEVGVETHLGKAVNRKEFDRIYKRPRRGRSRLRRAQAEGDQIPGVGGCDGRDRLPQRGKFRKEHCT